MDFHAISTFFGGCILPEDIRIDLVNSRRKLENHTAMNSVTNGYEYLLLPMVFHSLSGDLRRAVELLDILESNATVAKDTDMLVRIPVYQLHLQRIEKTSPPLDFWSDRSTEMKALDDARYEREDVAAFHRSLYSVEEAVNRQFKNIALPKIQVLEPQTLLMMWPMIHYTWNGSYLHHPEFKSKSRNLSYNVRSDGMGEFKIHHISNAKWRGIEETAFMMQLLNAKKQRASGKRTQFLQLEFEEAEISGQKTRNALRLLVMGDFELSKPFTSPLALNLMLYATGPGWNDKHWDALEDDVLCTQKAEVEALKRYDAAFGLFETEACHRGMAVIHLRRGCVFVMKAIDKLGSDGTTVICEELIKNATTEFEKAEPMLELDETHLCIVNTYQLLCQIIRQEVIDIKHIAELAQRIGRWGAKNSNPRPSRFSGMLFLRTGRRLARKDAVELAWRCCVCARITFAALGDSTLEAKVVEAQALYYQSIGHTVLPKRYLQCNRRVIKGAFKYVAGVIASCSGTQQDKLKDFQKKRYKAFLELWDNFFMNDQEAQQWYSDISSIYLVPDRKELPSKNSLDSMARLNRYIEKLSIDAEQEMVYSRNFSHEVRHDWREHQYALRISDKDKAREVLLNSKADGADLIMNQSIKLFSDWALLPPIDKIRDMVVFCYQSRFDDARKILETFPPIVLPNLQIKFPGLASHDPAYVFAADRISYFQISQHLWLCYISKSWQKGHNILVSLGDRRQTFFEELKRSPDVNRWMTMVALGYIRSKSSMAMLDQALDWYKEAYYVVTKNRSNLVDIQDRRIGGHLISPLDVYQGLAKIGVNLHIQKYRISPFRLFGRSLLEVNPRNSQITLQNIDLAILFFEQGRAGVLADMLLLHGDSGRLQDWLTLRDFADDINDTASPTQNNVSNFDERISNIANAALRDRQILQLGLRVKASTSLREWIVTDKIYNSIPDDTIVIHINADLEQSSILYVTNKGVQLAHRAAFTAYDLNTTVLQYLDGFRLRKLPPKMSLQEKLSKHEQYDQLVKKLSEHIVSPASTLLNKMKTIIFVPSKLLHNFPVSALTLEDVPLCESKTTYSCPSLQAFSLLARRSMQRKLEGTAKPIPGFATFMARRKGVKSSNTPLDVAAAFAITNADKFQFKAVPADVIERKLLLDEMRMSDIALVSSHGDIGKDAPWTNRLLLGTHLSTKEMLGNTFSTKIVVLQACLSSASGLDDGDDLIGFSHAVLSSGANSFIGALWEVNELAASVLISLFLSYYNSADSSMNIADALCRAQMALRRMKRAEVVEMLSSTQKMIEKAITENRFAEHKVNLNALARAVNNEIGAINLAEEPECPFDHPFFWAPFVLIGYGHQKVSS